jgi:heterodisulfide reductase subunit C
MLLSKAFQARNAQLQPRPEVEYCLQCAVCGLVCVVNHAEVYEPRHTFVYDLFNDGIEAKETLWGCPTCHKCEERCPYDFKPLELVKAHKETAFAAGLAPKEVYAEFEAILSTGSAFPVSSVTQRQRAELGLPDLPEQPGDDLALIAARTSLTAKLAAAQRAQRAREQKHERR